VAASSAGCGLGFDEVLWGQLAKLGLVALAVPLAQPGRGGDPVMFEELGRGLYHGPYLTTLGLAIPALLAAGESAACAELLPAASGSPPWRWPKRLGGSTPRTAPPRLLHRKAGSCRRTRKSD
jgi:hypothetical protein